MELDPTVMTHVGDAISKKGTITCPDFYLSYIDQLWFRVWGYNLQDAVEPGDRAAMLESVEYAGGKLWDAFELDRSRGSQLFVISFRGLKVNINPLGYYGGYAIDESKDITAHQPMLRANIIENRRFSDDSLAELCDLVDMEADERRFQKFFEENPRLLILATGPKYHAVHSQIVLTPESGHSMIPDFLLERMDTGMCDILDLKRANAVLRRTVKNRNRFSDAIMDVVSQLEHYRNYFEDKAHRDEFNLKYGLKAYRPQVMAIIGRRNDYYSDIERIRLEGLLPSHFELITYDDIIERIKSLNGLYNLP
jgi:hypothetical protein